MSGFSRCGRQGRAGPRGAPGRLPKRRLRPHQDAARLRGHRAHACRDIRRARARHRGVVVEGEPGRARGAAGQARHEGVRAAGRSERRMARASSGRPVSTRSAASRQRQLGRAGWRSWSRRGGLPHPQPGSSRAAGRALRARPTSATISRPRSWSPPWCRWHGSARGRRRDSRGVHSGSRTRPTLQCGENGPARRRARPSCDYLRNASRSISAGVPTLVSQS
jgi:hypothetical protein